MAEVCIQRCLRLESYLIRTLTSCPWGRRVPIPGEGEVLRRSTNATEAQWETSVRGLWKICKMWEKHGIGFSMGTAVGLADSSESILKLIGKVGADNLRVDLQVPLMGDRDKDMSEMDSAEKLGKHAIHVHANNSLNGKRCFLDEGEIDYDEILRGLKDFGFNGYVSVEHGSRGGISPLEIAQHEIAYLKNLAKKLSF